MLKELINSLSFMYGFAARSRGKLNPEELGGLRMGANAMTAHAADVLLDKSAELTEDQRQDLCEAELIDEHIEEMVDWLIRLEIV